MYYGTCPSPRLREGYSAISKHKAVVGNVENISSIGHRDSCIQPRAADHDVRIRDVDRIADG